MSSKIMLSKAKAMLKQPGKFLEPLKNTDFQALLLPGSDSGLGLRPRLFLKISPDVSEAQSVQSVVSDSLRPHESQHSNPA